MHVLVRTIVTSERFCSLPITIINITSNTISANLGYVPCSSLLQNTTTPTFRLTTSWWKNRCTTFVLQLSSGPWCCNFRLFLWQFVARSRCRRLGLLLGWLWCRRLWLLARYSKL